MLAIILLCVLSDQNVHEVQNVQKLAHHWLDNQYDDDNAHAHAMLHAHC